MGTHAHTQKSCVRRYPIVIITMIAAYELSLGIFERDPPPTSAAPTLHTYTTTYIQDNTWAKSERPHWANEKDKKESSKITHARIFLVSSRLTEEGRGRVEHRISSTYHVLIR